MHIFNYISGKLAVNFLFFTWDPFMLLKEIQLIEDVLVPNKSFVMNFKPWGRDTAHKNTATRSARLLHRYCTFHVHSALHFSHLSPAVVSFSFDDHVHNHHLICSGCHTQSSFTLLLQIQHRK
ncbi:hypothetical protein AMECASPLE_023069 [Ameca splendens]|uniref:Uncharacterized protein n=1 Tax=Ameca splendens TaxID=208324 RepID=A0ABV0XH24_9TELE